MSLGSIAIQTLILSEIEISCFLRVLFLYCPAGFQSLQDSYSGGKSGEIISVMEQKRILKAFCIEKQVLKKRKKIAQNHTLFFFLF